MTVHLAHHIPEIVKQLSNSPHLYPIDYQIWMNIEFINVFCLPHNSIIVTKYDLFGVTALLKYSVLYCKIYKKCRYLCNIIFIR